MGLKLALCAARRNLVHWMQAKSVPFTGIALHAPMTNWLNPARLAAVGIEAVISGLFGKFADRRESQSAIRKDHHDEAMGFIDRSQLAKPPEVDESNWCDYRSAGGDVWVDYLADTGDGWNSTYAMASLLHDPHLGVADPGNGDRELVLPRGRLLVMGGDQVYPVASPEEYDRRLVRPFRAALRPFHKANPNKGSIGELFAVPGNHDWYDGLSSFLGTFCRQYDGVEREGKVIGGRSTQQSRSYFAIKLPYDWWLWGLDSQLKGYIDQPQVDYFSHVAKTMHKEAETSGRPFKLVIFTGYPSWTKVDPKNPNPRFGSFSYMERLINNYGIKDGASPDSSGKVYLAVSGDTHHYARHTEQGPGNDVRHYVTCGGGGAYTHPTGQVGNEKFPWKWPRPGESNGFKPHGIREFILATFHRNGRKQEAVYPSKAQSARMSWEALLIAPRNFGFTLLMSAVSMVVLRTATIATTPATPALAKAATPAPTFGHLIGNATSSLAMLAYLVMLTVAFAYAADRGRFFGRLVFGAVNAVIQLGVILFVGAAALTRLQNCWSWLQLPLAALAAGFASATALGVYFLFCYHLLNGMHWNELFLGLRSTRYKSMVRMKFDADGGLTLYSIGLDDCEQGGLLRRIFGNPGVRPAKDGAAPATAKLRPHLIEPPVTIC